MRLNRDPTQQRAASTCRLGRVLHCEPEAGRPYPYYQVGSLIDPSMIPLWFERALLLVWEAV